MVRTSVTHWAIASCATFLFLPHFDVICDLLLNRRTATWNLFVNGCTVGPMSNVFLVLYACMFVAVQGLLCLLVYLVWHVCRFWVYMECCVYCMWANEAVLFIGE